MDLISEKDIHINQSTFASLLGFQTAHPELGELFFSWACSAMACSHGTLNMP